MMYTTSQQWELVGVTSYGQGCAEAPYAGVYTRVAMYQSWIATTTGNAYTNAISSNPASMDSVSSTASSIAIGTAPTFHLLSFVLSVLFSLFHFL